MRERKGLIPLMEKIISQEGPLTSRDMMIALAERKYKYAVHREVAMVLSLRPNFTAVGYIRPHGKYVPIWGLSEEK